MSKGFCKTKEAVTRVRGSWEGISGKVSTSGMQENSRSTETFHQYKSTGQEQTVFCEKRKCFFTLTSHGVRKGVIKRNIDNKRCQDVGGEPGTAGGRRNCGNHWRVSSGTQNNYHVTPGWTPDKEQLINKIGIYEQQNFFSDQRIIIHSSVMDTKAGSTSWPL